jgi:hypothetical protein
MGGLYIDFHTHSRFVKSLNTSFIILIPKTPAVIDLADFRSISLISGVFAKVLTNRMSRVMEKII